MNVVNNALLISELTDLYMKYEDALCNNNLEVMNELFWQAPDVVRFGLAENLYGDEEIRAFRASRPVAEIKREIFNLRVVTFDSNSASVTLEFRRIIGGVERLGRQSQMWHKFDFGWKIVSAHVSLLPSL
jgi:hypothetical protein